MDGDSSKFKGLKACTTCAGAKVRCDMLAGQRRCKRDLLRLESKFDSVAQLLSSSTSPLPPPNAAAVDNSPGHASNSRSPPASDSPLLSLFTQPLSAEAQVLAYQMFELYHREMMPLFPFVWISLEESPEKLLRERPVLYMAIMVVACQRDIDVQQELAQRWREEVGRRIWVQGEKSLGLLQGVLVYLAWHQTHLLLGTQLSNLMHTAMALVTELELDKEPSSNTKISPGGIDDFTRSQLPQLVRTHDERRCLLGVFWLSSILSMCVRNVKAMPWRPAISESCLVLQRETQFATDSYLIELVRIQQVASTINATLYNDLDNTETNISSTMLMAVSHLEKEIQELGASLAQGLPQQGLLMMSYYLLQVFLYKVGMDDRLTQALEPTAINPSPYAMRCSNILVSCLNAVKSLLESFLNLSNSVILSIPYPNWIPMGHAILIFSRLLVTNHSYWDPSILTDLPDFTATLDRVCLKIDATISEGAQLLPPRHLPPMFKKLRERLVNIYKRVEESSRPSAQATGAVSVPATSGMFEPGSMMLDEETEALLFSFFSDGGLM
ncbi:hypothetical protein FDECE_8473 [Fusarium decemcellulare]|nr:hypothetical protein FDECE_8473 [Fusarium decemcellulare]